ncbi:hypothetical protein JTE90_013463 [Oedothorax gibbosus]|uniref:OTU domain-containing protein n=1 Tax=Oedothorax gibbosus TaxID=931172 RepID=A0AAV6VP86_9ARAC|nr:hypothetical protein JTE90_013463 [Oedothorax gibbosus]
MSSASLDEELINRQRQERKDLLALTQKMKHAVPKGDKKKKKDVNTEISAMLSNLDLKHEEERKQLEVQCSTVINESNQSKTEEILNPDNEADSNLEEKLPTVTPKLSKAKKRRNKKAENEKARELAISQQDSENRTGARYLEAKEIANKLSQRNLTLHEVPPDGNCLFKAIEHQLTTHNINMSADLLREATSKYLMEHKDEYQPFLMNPQTDDMFTDSQYMEYCENIKNPGVWGGQVEIQALANICGKPIEIIQAHGPNIISGEQAGDTKLIISYHRHEFGLGAHYNSTLPKTTVLNLSGSGEV